MPTERQPYSAFMSACMTKPKYKKKFTAPNQHLAVCLSMAERQGLSYQRVGKADFATILQSGGIFSTGEPMYTSVLKSAEASKKAWAKRREGTSSSADTPAKPAKDTPAGPSKKITIQQAAKALAARGMKLGAGSFDMKTKTTTYEVTNRNGEKSKMSSDQIKSLMSKRADKGIALQR